MKKNIFYICLFTLFSAQAADYFLHDVSEFEVIKKAIEESIETRFQAMEINTQELQLVTNLFLYAFAYAKKDLQLHALQQKLFTKVLTLKNQDKYEKCINKILLLTDKLQHMKKKLERKKLCWHHATDYLDQNEQQHANELMSMFASERLSTLNQIMRGSNKDFETIIISAIDAFKKSAQTINILGNCLQAVLDKRLPFDQETNYGELRALDTSNLLLEKIENEAATAVLNCMTYSRFYTEFLTIASVLDMIYYQVLHERLLKYSNSHECNTVMFNEHGIISFEQRTKLLPHVIN